MCVNRTDVRRKEQHMATLKKVILKNDKEKQEFKLPFTNVDWCNWHRFMAYLFEVGRKIFIIEKFDDGTEKTESLF